MADAAGSGSQETAAAEAQATNESAMSEEQVVAHLETLASGGVSPEANPAEAVEPATEPEPKDAEDEEPDAEEESEEDEPKEDQEKPKELSHGEQKRISKLTARAKTAEEKAAALEKELAELKAKPALTPEQLANVEIPAEYLNANEAQVLQQHAVLKQGLSWLKQNRNGFSGTVQGAPVEFTADKIADLREEYLEKLAEIGPRAAQIRERAHAELAADLSAARAAQVKPAAQAATAKATVKAKLKPTVAVPAAAGVSPQSVMGARPKGLQHEFEQNRHQGDIDAAAAALQHLVPG